MSTDIARLLVHNNPVIILMLKCTTMTLALLRVVNLDTNLSSPRGSVH